MNAGSKTNSSAIATADELKNLSLIHISIREQQEMTIPKETRPRHYNFEAEKPKRGRSDLGSEVKVV